jgi:multiple sugar transport system ATP-binding protein
MSAIELRSLTLYQGRRPVVQDLSLVVESGEFVVLLGPSGCGKSTLLAGIAGLIPAAGGSVLIDGTDVTSADPAARNVSMVFQSYALYPTMSVAGNLGFALRMRGLPRQEIAARVARVAALLQIDALLGQRPAELSGGQRQRVAIGRALVRETRLLLLDEPLSNLDAGLRADLRRELKLLHQRLGTTMIYVTHDQAEAMSLATRVAVLRDGRIEQVGPPAEVYRQPNSRFVAGFFGSPPMNFMDGNLLGLDRAVVAGAECTTGVDPGLAARGAPPPGADVTIGWRAEHACVDAAGPFLGTVETVDLQGSQAVVWLHVQGQSVARLAAPDRLPAVGARVRFAVDPAHVLVFDRSDGRRL